MSTLATSPSVSAGGTSRMASIGAVLAVLRDVDFPATRDDIVLAARRGGVEHGVLRQIRDLPNLSFNGLWDVSRALQSGAVGA